MLQIALYIFSMFILYVVIETAVRKGIDNSRVGQLLLKDEEGHRTAKHFDQD
ncbi:MAG: hypothetical protein ACRC5C_14000 [Bacilli bacterium]